MSREQSDGLVDDGTAERAVGPLGGAKLKRCTYEPPTQRTPGPDRSLPGTGTQPVIDWFPI